MENGGGRDLEEKETFLLARNPIYDQEWLWDNEVLSLFLFSFRQSLRSVSFKEERSSCTTITQKLEKTGFGWRGFFSLKNHSPKCKKKKKRCCCTTFFSAAFFAFKTCTTRKARAVISGVLCVKMRNNAKKSLSKGRSRAAEEKVLLPNIGTTVSKWNYSELLLLLAGHQ